VFGLISEENLRRLARVSGEYGTAERVQRLWGWFAEYFATQSSWHRRLWEAIKLAGDPDAVVVLSGGSEEENAARIRFALEQAQPGGRFVLDGATEQMLGVVAQFRQLQTRSAELVWVDAGSAAVANTATQFDALAGAGHKTLIVVTSGYHVPRVVLTAKKRLPDTCCVVVGVPWGLDWGYDVDEMCAGEIWRILEYSARGDIADPSILWSEE